MTKTETAKLLALLKEHADQKEITPATVEYWHLAMDDIPFEAAMVAYRLWIRRKKWMPKPSEIRDLVDEHVFGIPSPETARVQVERSLKENYPGQPLKYEPDPLVIEALRTVGGTHVFRNAQSGRETESLWQRFAFVYAELRAERLEAIDYAGEYAQLASGTSGHIRALGNGDRRTA
jgi:hypothetical protein